MHKHHRYPRIIIQQAVYLKLRFTLSYRDVEEFMAIRSVRHILKGQLAFDTRLKHKNIAIHPILVLHYRMFNAGGLNKVLNLWFQDELKKLKDEGLDISKVRPFTIIDIDTLIFHKDIFSSRKLNLEDCLLEYQNDYLNFSITGKRYNSEE
ncbi:MAG: hypothetical protein COA88_02365 [Kordia sp.]|nr:MAG: hypothetical protein COA88_02365 [Kordia sp.]